jgi:glycosyltransferase involved in cell wall biosynthesis
LRILIESNAPWCPTGYGQQTAIFAPRIKALGHEVAVAAFYGLQGARTKWQDIVVYPAGLDLYGNDVIDGHIRHFGTDLFITLMDIFALDPSALKALDSPPAHWFPVDCEGLGRLDKATLEATEGTPITFTEFGRAQLRGAGYEPLYVPHGVETQVFKPGNKKEYRKVLGIPQDAFVIGMNAANKDKRRKGFPEQFVAFAGFRARHKDAMLLIHSTPNSGGGLGTDLTAIAKNLGIQDAIRWADPYSYASGVYTPGDMAAWYNCLDIYSGCSYAEGFGLPLIEAQACGIPVVTTDASAMAELAGPGWKAGAEPDWHEGHEAWWAKPLVGEIAAAYEHAYNGGVHPRKKPSREFALQFDADKVTREYWKPALDELAAERGL